MERYFIEYEQIEDSSIKENDHSVSLHKVKHNALTGFKYESQGHGDSVIEKIMLSCWIIKKGLMQYLLTRKVKVI